MNLWHQRIGTAACLAALAIFGGCNSSTAPPPVDEHAHGHDHEHAEPGPHGGDLIELGDEEYHGELVHDDKAGTVTIYILDAAAKTAVPIDAKEISINLTHDGQAEQFKLAAAPESTDPEGKSSKFVSDDKHLAEDLDSEDLKPELVVEIMGLQFRGKVEHHHDHEHGHDHAHETKPASK